jgi:hypothetical protein
MDIAVVTAFKVQTELVLLPYVSYTDYGSVKQQVTELVKGEIMDRTHIYVFLYV